VPQAALKVLLGVLIVLLAGQYLVSVAIAWWS